MSGMCSTLGGPVGCTVKAGGALYCGILQDCQLYICGTKYDLIAENPALRAVSTEAVKTLADGWFIFFGYL